MALTNKLSAIGDAIRSKTGKTDLMTLDEMPTAINEISVGSAAVINSLEITSNGTYTATDCDGYSPITVNVPQDGAPTAEDLTFTGTGNYMFMNGSFNWLIEKYSSQMTIKNINSASYMFAYCNLLEEIPLEISFYEGVSINAAQMFNSCNYLKSLPTFKNYTVGGTQSMFQDCQKLRYFPENFGKDFDYEYQQTDAGRYDSRSQMFNGCCSLRQLPMDFIKTHNRLASYTNSIYYKMCTNCYALDEIVNLPVYALDSTWTSNAFAAAFSNCGRLKNLTFATNEDGTPIAVKWRNQTIDLTKVGYVDYAYYITDTNSYNSGITADKEVTTTENYLTLKDDPDWFTAKAAFSRYNHDSAVATINSLPDASTYLSGTSYTNNIRFNSSCGSLTDGGGVSTLTEEEIAVAAAKGWTVAII